MNSIQLMQRLARNLNVVDASNPPADVLLDILQAVNAGLTAFYREMPGIYKRTTISYLARAPRSVTVTFTQQYSNMVNGTPFTNDMVGCTLRFDTADADTVITGNNSVLDAWRNSNVGPLTAKVYSDIIPIQDVIEDVVGHIKVYDNSQSLPTILVRNERLRGGRVMGWGYPYDWADWWGPFDGWIFGSVGRPRYYYLEPAGASQGAEPEMVLRLFPFPDIDYNIRFEAELYTQRIRFPDFTTAREIYVGDAYVHDLLIPLCERELITSPFWRDEKTKVLVENRGKEVIDRKMRMVPRDVGSPSNLIGTPRGY